MHNNLTESSSSGSVTDSVCTACEQKSEAKEKKDVAKEFLQQETNGNTNVQNSKKDENTNIIYIWSFNAVYQYLND